MREGERDRERKRKRKSDEEKIAANVKFICVLYFAAIIRCMRECEYLNPFIQPCANIYTYIYICSFLAGTAYAVLIYIGDRRVCLWPCLLFLFVLVVAVVFVLRLRLFCHYYYCSPLTLLLHTIFIIVLCIRRQPPLHRRSFQCAVL